MAAPGWTLHGHGDAEEGAHVGDGTVQLLEVHVQRLTLGTARLLVQADALHVETFEDRLVENLARVLYICRAHFQLDPANEIRNEPVQPDQVFVRQKTFNASRLQTALR